MMSNKRFILGLVTVMVLDVGIVLYPHNKPESQAVVVTPPAPAMDARDTVLYISCPNTPLRKVHYSRPITWWLETNGVVIATAEPGDSNVKYIGAYPGTRQCVVER